MGAKYESLIFGTVFSGLFEIFSLPQVLTGIGIRSKNIINLKSIKIYAFGFCKHISFYFLTISRISGREKSSLVFFTQMFALVGYGKFLVRSTRVYLFRR